jgi:pyruvate kinase
LSYHPLRCNGALSGQITVRFSVYAFSPDIKVVRTLSLAWNVYALHLPFAGDIGDFTVMQKSCSKKRLLCLGDTYAIISGSSAIPGATNTLRLKRCAKRKA